MGALPSLTHNPRTRIGNEVLLYYNLGKVIRVGAINRTATGYEKVQESSCAGTLTAPVSGFSAATIVKSNETLISALGTAAGQIPAQSPVGTGAEYEGTYSTDIEDYSMSGGAEGDSVDILLLPDPNDDVLICFDQGFTANVGDTTRPIARKFNPADHFVRQRPENSISLSDFMISNWEGLRRINGREVTLVAKIYPDGGGVASEIQYFTNCRFNVPFNNVPAEGNDSIQIDADGVYNNVVVFSDQPS